MITEAAILCLALNAYHEASGQGVRGMLDVSQVVINRVEALDRRWPEDVCLVITQGGAARRGKCQFSWYCDGRSDVPRDPIAWRQALIVAEAALRGGARSYALSEATCYHSARRRPPEWAKRSKFVARRYGHVFYKC